MAVVKDVTIKINVEDKSIKGAKKLFDDLNKEIAKQEGLLGKLQKKEETLLKLRKRSSDPKAIQAFNKELEKTRKEMTSLTTVAKKQESQMKKFSKSILGVGAALAGAFALKEIVTGIVKTIAKFEKLEAVLTNTLGSKSEAQKAMKQIADFAAKTPFSVDELTSSFVKLANQGFKPTTDEMRKLGDLAASTGKSFDQLSEAIIDAQVGEFERLKEFGIRAQKEGDKVTFTFKGVKEQVDFTEQSIQDYLLSLGNVVGVSGAMAAISATLEGKFSNLGDAYDQFVLSLNSGEGVISEVVGGLLDIGISALSALSGTTSLADEFLTMSGEVSNLESNLIPLLNRYDELTTKSSLSKDEQIELESIISDVAKIVPTAVTEFDKYGKALKISTKDAKAFVEEQKNILKVKNAEAIIEQKEAIKELEIESKLLLNTLNGVAGGYSGITRENGELFKTVVKGGKVTRTELEKIEGGVAKFSEKLSKAQAELSGRKGILAQLTGTETEAAKAVRLASEELDDNTDSTDKNTVSKKKQKDTLKELVDRHRKAIKEVNDFNDVFGKEGDLIEDDDEFLKSAGLDDEGLEKTREALAKKQEIIDEADIKELNSKIENDEKLTAHEQLVADTRFALNEELGFSALGLAAAITGAINEGNAAQNQALVFEKLAAIASIIINTQIAASKMTAGAGIFGIPLAAQQQIIGAAQVATVIGTAIPQFKAINAPKENRFKDGVIDLRGAGTKTSDSIDAKLSVGESVMTADETTTHKPMLKAIRDNRFDEWMNKELIKQIYIGKSDRNIRNVDEKSTDINFPDSYNIRNARAISKPIVDAIEEANFLRGLGW